MQVVAPHKLSYAKAAAAIFEVSNAITIAPMIILTFSVKTNSTLAALESFWIVKVDRILISDDQLLPLDWSHYLLLIVQR